MEVVSNNLPALSVLRKRVTLLTTADYLWPLGTSVDPLQRFDSELMAESIIEFISD